MHWYRNRNDGKERLWVDEEEFDSITEYELRAAVLYPTIDRPAVDIERFIQRHLKAALDQHAILGDGIVGAIEFTPERINILISRHLTEMADEVGCPPGVRGRWRATMAHEAAHGLLHRPIFETSPAQGILFDVPIEKSGSFHQIIQCADADISFEVGTYNWREYQANKGMAALLMPRKVFIKLAREETTRLAQQRQPILPQSQEYGMLVKRLSVYFEVSQRAAMLRLKTMEGAVGIGQSCLGATLG